MTTSTKTAYSLLASGFFILALLMVSCTTWCLVSTPHQWPAGDFRVIYQSAKQLKNHHPNYAVVYLGRAAQQNKMVRPPYRPNHTTPSLQPGIKGHALLPTMMRNLNTPLATSFMMPLTRWSRQDALTIWRLLCFGTLLLGIWPLIQSLTQYRHNNHQDRLMISAWIMLCTPYVLNMHLGQLGTLCFALVSLFWMWARQHLHTPIRISLGIGALAAFKPFFALYALPDFLKNKTQWAYAAAFACVCYTLPLLFLQHPIWFAHGHTLLAALHDDRALPKLLSPINGSILATVTKIMPYLLSHFGFHLTFAYVAASVPVMLLLWGLCQHILRPPLDRQQHFDVCFGLMTCALLWISPLGWQYYDCLLWLPLMLAGLRYLAFPVAIVPYCLGSALFCMNLSYPIEPYWITFLSHHPNMAYDLPWMRYFGCSLAFMGTWFALHYGYMPAKWCKIQAHHTMTQRKYHLFWAGMLGTLPTLWVHIPFVWHALHSIAPSYL